MCVTCGCGGDHHHHHHHHHDQDGGAHEHEHGHQHEHEHEHEHKHEAPLGAAHEAGTDQARAIQLEEDILGVNNAYARDNRAFLKEHRLLALNLVSSPGSGKTSLLAATLAAKRFPAGVIEGDQSTELDAERIRATGAPAVQINTGRECHLDAHRTGHAMDEIGIGEGKLDGGVLFIENVGNLVCPAAFDLGEAAKVVLLSVTEGDDKPLKYPDMFCVSSLLVITKTDLLPYVPFSVEKCIAAAKKVNPSIEVLTLSSTTGEGMEAWFGWIEAKRKGIA